jgi:PKD repeat protein
MKCCTSIWPSPIRSGLVLLALALTTGAVLAASSSVVISEVYESGSKTGASYYRDYVVLKNVSSSSVDLNGWSLQHYKTTLGWRVLNLTNSIPAGGFYLIRCYYDGSGTLASNLPAWEVSSPQTSDWNLSTSTPEAVAVVNNTATLASCTDASIVDLVGFGATPPCSEGTATSVTTATQSSQRAASGCQDTDDNATDFALAVCNPRNTSDTPSSCSLPPTIITQPASLTVETGSNVTFSVLASGSQPLGYQWYLDGTNALADATNTTLYLASVTTNDAGGYSVTVTNAIGSTNSVTATLTVNPPAIPLITQNPVSQSVVEGDPVTNSVSVTGSLPLAYQWYFITTVTNAVVAGTNANYIISSATTNDAGDYYVVITNAYGSATSETISIQVNPNTQPPTIDIQPASQSSPAGANVSFSVTASGAAPLSYQWRKSSINILPGGNPSATNTILNLSNISTNDQGGYDVIVTNSFGSVTSSVATLSIITNSLPINPNDFINPRFSTVNITSNITYASGSSYYKLDVYQPAGDTNTSRPVIVWIHGGSNQTGTDKYQSYIVTYSTDFAKRGYVCMAIDYRVYSSASYDCSTDKDWCKLPANREAATDCDIAFSWIRANAATYNINTNWMFVAGGSAGGKSALNWAYVDGTNAPATPGRTFNKHGIIAVGDLWGSPEFPFRWYVGAQNTNAEYTAGGAYIGNEPPYHYLHCGAPPTVIVHGTADTTVPFQNSIDLSNQLATVGVPFELNPIPGANHTPTSYNYLIEPWVANFFAKYWWAALTNTPSAAPTASFTMSVTNGAPPLAVAFNDTSTGCAYSWSWNLGDGNTTNFPNGSTNFPPVPRNPIHTFAAGTYAVTLTITGPSGTSTATNTVVAGSTPPPAALFSASPTNGVEPLNVSFTDASSNSPTGWSWSFGDGGTSTLQNPSHAYTTAGVYTVRLIASNAGGSHTNTKTAYITVITAAQSWQNHYGVAPDSSDPLGKGISNTNQFMAGFNPNNAAASLRVISVQTSNADVSVTYLGASGDNTYAGGPQFRTNVLEYAGGVGGNYSNGFSNTGISQVLSNGNGSGTVSTMTDTGGATNVPSRYYRVRVLVP